MESIYSSCDSNRKWSCPRCTYLNWPKSQRCIQCQTTRERDHKTRECLTEIFEDLKLNDNRKKSSGSSAVICNEDEEEVEMEVPPISSDRILDYYNKEPSTTSTLSNINSSKEQSQSRYFTLNNKQKSIEDSVSIHGAIGSNNRQLSLTTTNIAGITGSNMSINSSPSSSGDSDKWSCRICTYDNWPRATKCVMCLTQRGIINQSSFDECDRSSYGASYGNNRNNDSISLGGNNRMSLTGSNSNRRTRDIDARWLEACRGVVDGNIGPVEIYLAAGGDPSRQLTQTEVAILNRPSAFDVGLTLIHLALRFQQENLLATLLSQVDADGAPPVVKRVPAFAAPDLAIDIRRHFLSCLRQRKGPLRCYYITEISTFTLPSEIEDYPTEIQETLFDELLDRDVQKELDDGQIINWSLEVVDQLNSRLYALWNRSAGDCLLDSVLQATWGIFDRENGLRQALSDSLQECATLFYQRWRENEILHAHLLDFSLNDSQCAADWAKLLSIASKPGSSLEQLHIFALAHILRRPIIVYGVKYVKSFRGETLGFARYEGLYLPFFWEPGFCWKSPIALGYTRGHFSALVTLDPDCDPMSTVGTAAQLVPEDIAFRCSYLPLTSVDGNLLPIHFLMQSEIGKEELIMNQWLDVRFTETGVMVACQQVQKFPVLVGQMVEEWMNHYRRLGQLSGGPFLRPAGTATCYSSEAESDAD